MEKGFTVAATIASLVGSPNPTEDPEIGQVKFYRKQWDREDPDVSMTLTEVPSRPCKTEDFNDDEDTKPDALFYSPSKLSKLDLAKFGKTLKCIDAEPFDLLGSFETSKASNLMVTFDLCDPAKRTCKDRDAIDKWMIGKYFFTLEN